MLARIGSVVGLAALACAPKEAQDPSDIIAEDPSFLGEEPGALDSTEGPGPGPRAGDRGGTQLATYAECEAAARRVEELGIELAIREETDPAERQALEARKKELLSGEETKQRIRRNASDCVAHRRTQVETECIRQADSAEAIDECAVPGVHRP